MCGIAGVWHPAGDLEQAIRAMTNCLEHRGPDAEGFYVSAESGLALGHRRLSIVDLSPTGAQPMTSASGRYVMAFNGEVYNFRSLRKELEADGVGFRGSSDTEVMLALFERDGVPAAVRQFNGMFAGAVWDTGTRQLWLFRDRMGEKPLYFGQFGSTLAFASELKSLRKLENCPREIDAQAVADVLERGYVRGGKTIHPGVLKLAPGSILLAALQDGRLRIQEEAYWSVNEVLRGPSEETGMTDPENALDELLRSVVADEMVADVPVGAFLSGGIDSSLTVALMQRVSSKPVRTFTIGFEEASVDESPFARQVAKALGTDHTEIRLSAHKALDYVHRLPEIFDEPFADPSQLPTLLVCEATRRHVTVALSGDGGDELFGGYSQYHARDSLAALASRVPPLARTAVAAGVGAIPGPAFHLLGARSDWSGNLRARLSRTLRNSSPADIHESNLSQWVDPTYVMASHHRSGRRSTGPAWPPAATHREAQMAYDMQTYLPDDILVKVDRSAMAFSLETRAPLLDHRIVEFALRQPLCMKIRDGEGKYLLRSLLHRYLPRELWERPKQGFTIPLAEWLRGPLRGWGVQLLENDDVLRTWFHPGRVQAIWDQHQRGVDHADRLWRILVVMQWVRTRQA